jgi:biofilm PGA synthesis N-glycosyltransferase PgaC
MKTKYVLVTPAYNEEEFIEKAIKSVISQTILPQKWLILDDGSTDKTSEIIKRYEAKHNFIICNRVQRLEVESYYARRIQVFLIGYEKIKNEEYDFVATLDADLSLEPTYYESILTEFDRNPRLGIASGFFVNKIKGQIQKVVGDPDEISTPGGLQVFRRECYEAIGGYSVLKEGGSDALTCILARMYGWQTQHFPQYQAIHYRALGTGNGTHLLVAKYRDGLVDYILGTHPLFMLAKSFRRVFLEQPFLLASLTRLSGFFSGYLSRKKRGVPDEVIKFVWKEQIQRLRAWGHKKFRISV